MRQTFIGCRVVMTLGASLLPDELRSELIRAIQDFDTFNEANDPHGEHDFGAVTLSTGYKFFWKFDYYDDQYEFFQENGNRVLTIMRTDEY